MRTEQLYRCIFYYFNCHCDPLYGTEGGRGLTYPGTVAPAVAESHEVQKEGTTAQLTWLLATHALSLQETHRPAKASKYSVWATWVLVNPFRKIYFIDPSELRLKDRFLWGDCRA